MKNLYEISDYSIMFCTIPSNNLLRLRKIFITWDLICVKLISKYFKKFKYLGKFSNNMYIIFSKKKIERFGRLYFFLKYNLESFSNYGLKVNGFFYKGLFFEDIKFIKKGILNLFFYNIQFFLVLNYIVFFSILNIMFFSVRLLLKKYV